MGKKRKREQTKFLLFTSASIFSSTYRLVPTYGREADSMLLKLEQRVNFIVQVVH